MQWNSRQQQVNSLNAQTQVGYAPGKTSRLENMKLFPGPPAILSHLSWPPYPCSRISNQIGLIIGTFSTLDR
jgi:hypothetical protein